MFEGPVAISPPDVPVRNWSTSNTHLKWSSGLASSERKHFCMFKTVLPTELLHSEWMILQNSTGALNHQTKGNADSTGSYLAVEENLQESTWSLARQEW